MKNSVTLFFVLLSFVTNAQDLLGDLDKETKPTTEYTTATFKSTRLINGQTIETKGKGALEFIFAQ